MIQSFEVGKLYWTRSACDWDTKFYIKVVARTPKTIMIEDHRGTRRLHIRLSGDAECVSPFGTYSMAPVISAKDRDGII